MESRRRFLKAGSAVAAGFPAILKGASVSGVLKVGLVGCGGRGAGAAAQALKADPAVELTAVSDVFAERVDASLEQLQRNEKIRDRIKVESAAKHVGLDGFQKVIASVDVVLLATPPGFRPQHFRAAVDAGKHIFCEKPVGTDVPGVRSILASAEKAKEKGLSVVSGFCWRYNTAMRATFEQIHNGAIGDLVAYYATYYTSPVKPIPPATERPAGMSDVEWQVKNWYNFVWTCGDSLVEQAVHSVDKVCWAMKEIPPVSCVAVGGRQVPANGGNIYDHFEVNYLYPNNVRAFVACRQQDSCYKENADYILGTKGLVTIGRGPVPYLEGQVNWTFEGERNDMYQEEHNVLFRSIREGKPVNDGASMSHSCLVALMGRIAAYTGQQVTWDQVINSQESLVPADLEWNMKLPEAPMAIPGINKVT